MRFCDKHWSQLRAAIDARGLTPLVALRTLGQGMTLRDLPAHWRSRARELARYAPPAAEAFTAAAEELERALRDADLEPLSLAEAAAECGYTRSHLRRLIRDGRLPNSGTPDEPRILRCHLPRKPGHGTSPARGRDATLRAQVARAVAAGE